MKISKTLLKNTMLCGSITFFITACGQSPSGNDVVSDSNADFNTSEKCVDLSCDSEVPLADGLRTESLDSYIAGEIGREYDKSIENANEKYEGKTFEVVSQIDRMEPDLNNNLIVFLDDFHEPNLVATGDEDFEYQMTNNEFGVMDMVHINCTGAGMVEDYALLKDCEFIRIAKFP